MPAVPTAVREKSRLAHSVRFLHHTSRFTAASVRHADATMDQMMVTQLMECGKMGEGRWGKAEMLKAES
jgi:hypothetical protein